MPRQRLTPEQRRRRVQALAQDYGSLRIEGLEPTAEGRRLHQRWADGLASERSPDERSEIRDAQRGHRISLRSSGLRALNVAISE